MIKGAVAQFCCDSVRPEYKGTPAEEWATTALTAVPEMVGCSVLHPQQPSCYTQQWETWRNSFRRSIPVYLSVNLAATLFNMGHFFRHPITSLGYIGVGTARSAAFLATFVQL